MYTEDLINNIKQLKQFKPVVEPPVDTKRLERISQFERQNNLSLDPNKKSGKKKVQKRQGMFRSTSFCFPMLEPDKDPSPKIMAHLASAICSQGGRIVEFHKDAQKQQNVRYILVSFNSDVGFIRQSLKGRMFYVAIIDYKWVEDCLRHFKKIDPAMYNLENGYIKMENDLVKHQEPEQKRKNDAQNNNLMISEVKREEQPLAEAISQVDRIDDDSNGNSIDTERMSDEERSNEFQHYIKMQQEDQHDWDHGQENLEAKKQDIKQDSECEDHVQQSKKGKEEECDSDGTEKMDSQEEKRQKIEEDSSEFQRYGPYYRKKMPADEEEQCKQQPEQKGQYKKRTYYFNRQWLGNKPNPRPPWWMRKKGPPKAKLPLGSHNFSINRQIIDLLKKMQQIYANNGDRKQYTYLRIIASISNYGKEIKNAQELKNIKSVGRQTINKVKEFLKTGTIRQIEDKLHCLSSDPLKELLKVHGIGRSTAIDLHHQGIRTIENLKKHEHLLNTQQKLGLKYVDDFQKRIPREKVARMYEYVKQTLFYVARTEVKHDVEVVGSYRRGKQTCGDMDILITRKDGLVERALLQNLVLELQKRKFITDHITHPKIFDGSSSVNYNGVCQFQDETHHRIDLKLYPVNQYAFAMLYFTGSDLFNRQMRLMAIQKGLTLSDHDIKIRQRYGNRSRVWKGGKIPVCRTENDIFQLMGMQYRAPHQRQI